MIRCSVCGTENNELSVVCSSCKSFLQGRLDALNLFSTMWGLIESPRATFRKIVLAKHKNYSLLLSAAFGVSLALNIAWYKSLGQVVSGTLVIMVGAMILGPFLGLFTVFSATAFLRKSTSLMGGLAQQKSLFAALAYATTPMVLSLVFFAPIEVAVFGGDFFGTNPPPSVIKPFEYMLLIGLKWAAVLYSVYLATEGTLVASAFERKRFVPVALLIFGMTTAGWALLHYVKV